LALEGGVEAHSPSRKYEHEDSPVPILYQPHGWRRVQGEMGWDMMQQGLERTGQDGKGRTEQMMKYKVRERLMRERG
jgi:hypothetical protein